MPLYNQLKIWMLAFRPKTLTAAVAPVLIGTAMAFGDGIAHLPTALICLATALMMQIGTNVANDYFDFKKGTDTAKRLGPTRVTQAGLIAPHTTRNAFVICFILAGLGCLILVARAGWPIAILGIISILSGIFYTAGPRALGYIGLGDLFVFVFFGPVAVAGTYYVQSFELNMAVILAGFAPGLISAAILTVNNYRDIEEDQRAHKRTLAVRFGRTFAQAEYLWAMLLATLMPVIIYGLIMDHPGILLATFTSILAIKPMQVMLTTHQGLALNQTLATTGKLLLVYSILFAVGWLCT